MVDTVNARYGFTFDASTGTYTIRLLSIRNEAATSDSIVLYSYDRNGTPYGGETAIATQTNTISVTLPNALPAIGSVSPTTGSPLGGTSVVITGTGFAEATSVKFGGTAATSFTVDNESQITAVAPAGAVGPADIVVATAIGSTTFPGGFNYVVSAPGAPTIGAVTTLDPDGAQVNFTPPANNGGGAITEYVVTSSPHGKIGVGTQSPISVRGLWSGMSYTFTVTAKNAAGVGPSSSASQAVVPRNFQTIGFSPGPQTFGTTPVLSAMNTSGLPVVFSSTTPDVCTVTPPGELTFHSAGTCTISADAEGNSAYFPAQTITRSFAVNPALPGAPTIGAATAGDEQAEVSFVPPASSGGAPVTYTVTADPDGATGTGAQSPITVAGLTNGVAYTFSVTATNAAGTGSTSAASNSITPVAAQAITFINPGAQNFGTAPILTATSDSRLSPTFTSSTEGVCTVTSSGELTFVSAGICTINALQAGDAAHLPAAQVSQSFAVNPVVPGPPLIGGATAGDTQATITFTAPASDGGAAVRDYTVTVNPGGATFTASSSPIIATALSNGATYTFTVTANNAVGMSAPSAASNAVTPVATQFITFANPGSQTAGTSSTLTATTSSGLSPVFTSITPGVCTITGATLTSVAVGTCTITVDQPGNAAYLAAPTVTQSFEINPQLPAAGDVSATVAANSTANPVTLSLSGGAADSVAVAAAPSHGSAIASGTSISYTPDPGYSGADSFTYTATNVTGTSAPATVRITVAASKLTFSPAGGDLPGAMVGEAYLTTVTAKGGQGGILYSLSRGKLPKGMILNVSTGELSGPLDADVDVGTYSFMVAARDATGNIGEASYRLAVKARGVTVVSRSYTLEEGDTPRNVYLNEGATGGPFTGAEIAFVRPPNAGKAEIIEGELATSGAFVPVGYYLKFTPNPGFFGTAVIGYRLESALGASDTGTVSYAIVHNGEKVAAEIDGLVRDFVRTRQNLLSRTIEVPGLIERRKMGRAGNDPISTSMSPSENGITLGLSTSLAQLRSTEEMEDGGEGVAAVSPFNVWIDGAVTVHQGDENDGRWGTFGLISAGADYLLSEKALIGLSFHFDRMTDPTDADAELTGNGWLAGPYASFELGSGVFLDTSLLYGGSWNDVDTKYFDGSFDTRRLMWDTKLQGQWQLGDATVLTPALRAVFLKESVDDYSVSSDDGSTVELKGFTEDQLRLSIGADLERVYRLENGLLLTPRFGGTAGFAARDNSGAFGTVSAGLNLSNDLNWDFDFSLLYGIESEGEQAVGLKAGAHVRF
ncbi:fibronectin type III domain-containing protein [Ensifer adhaerens]|nr:fibronectin type III domain-containing protein [Ensifer adhaerens]